MKCTDLLLEDHKTIMRALEVLHQMANRVEEDLPVDHSDVETILHFLHDFADDNHQVKEESALFPELMRAATAKDRALRQMLFEHDQERSLVAALEEALLTKNNTEFVHFARKFVSLIRSHVYKEDHILFDIVEQSLSPEQDEKVVTELNKFQMKPEWLADLRRLEWKYLRKAA